MEMTVPPEATDGLLDALRAIDGVITLSVRRGESVKPPGDVISAAVLNQDVDAVVAEVVQSTEIGPVSVSTASLDSLIDANQQLSIRADVDEATWEEAETAMRRHTRPTLNFFLTTAMGGIIAACALVASSEATAAVALVAAGIIAPVFEPLARLSLAITNRDRHTVMNAARNAVLSYMVLIAVAVVTMLLLRSGSHHFVADFHDSSTVREVRHPPATNLLLSACGAIAGVVMVAAGRFTQMAGALVALQLLPAAATLGAALEVGDGTVAAHSLGRLAIDIGMVLVAGLVWFTYKHVAVHARRRMSV